MSKLVFMWHERENEPIWYNHYATITLINKNFGSVYQLKTTKFDPTIKVFLKEQVWIGEFRTLAIAKTVAEKMYDVETTIRENAIY